MIEDDDLDDLISIVKKQRDEVIRLRNRSKTEIEIEDVLVDTLAKEIDKEILKTLLNMK